MKTKTVSSKRSLSKFEIHTFSLIQLLLEADLIDPVVEATARKSLKYLRKKGHLLPSFDVEDPDCILCLYTTLQCAADLSPLVQESDAQGRIVH